MYAVLAFVSVCLLFYSVVFVFCVLSHLSAADTKVTSPEEDAVAVDVATVVTNSPFRGPAPLSWNGIVWYDMVQYAVQDGK